MSHRAVTLSVMAFLAVVLVLGCKKEAPKPEEDETEGVHIKAGGVEVKAGKEGVNVKAGGTEVTAGEEGVHVKAGEDGDDDDDDTDTDTEVEVKGKSGTVTVKAGKEGAEVRAGGTRVDKKGNVVAPGVKIKRDKKGRMKVRVGGVQLDVPAE